MTSPLDAVGDVTVRQWMSPAPVTVEPDDTLLSAQGLMRAHGIRHLPVLEGDRLVGIVSDGDIHLLETLSDVDPAVETVEEAMTDGPFTVGPEETVGGVARVMARRRYGCVVVVESGTVVGIFTTVDALRCLADLLGG